MAVVRYLLISLLFFLVTHAGVAGGLQSKDYADFAALPVIHEGRIKPLGRAAQLLLQDISGKRAPLDSVATPWLASVLFNPSVAETVPVFAVPEPALHYVLGLPPQDFYSFRELNAAFVAHADLVLSLRDTPSRDLSDDQQALLRLYARVTYYEQLKNAFSQPLSSQGSLSAEQRALGENNLFFRVIPSGSPTSPGWSSPWQAYLAGHNPLLDQWIKLAAAYLADDATHFGSLSRQLYDRTLARSGETSLGTRLRTELVYTALQPHYLSLLLYAAALLCLAGAIYKPHRYWARMGWLLTSAGLKMQVLGLICRMFILQRPPVSTLYESILFVGTMLVGGSLFMAWKTKDKSFLFAAAFIGLCLQILGFAINDEAETLKVLQAVLDTKFWLATHVIIITSGYALCLLTSAAAHFYLYRVCWPKMGISPRKPFRRAYLMSLVSLLFITIGTLLGGVWADQSWGRFWGWDPKENGALLIGLWLIWLLHGRVTQHFSDFGFAIGLALLTLVVGISWIGVNLLGIGLHSYGFLNGSAASLIILFASEILFVATCFYRRARHAVAF